MSTSSRYPSPWTVAPPRSGRDRAEPFSSYQAQSALLSSVGGGFDDTPGTSYAVQDQRSNRMPAIPAGLRQPGQQPPSYNASGATSSPANQQGSLQGQQRPYIPRAQGSNQAWQNTNHTMQPRHPYPYPITLELTPDMLRTPETARQPKANTVQFENPWKPEPAIQAR